MSQISTNQKVGLGLASLVYASGILSVLAPRPDGVEGTPLPVAVIVILLGIVGLIAATIAWRQGRREAIRVAAGSLILVQLTAMPALFVDTPAAIKVLIGTSMLLTMIAIVLMFSPTRRPVPALG